MNTIKEIKTYTGVGYIRYLDCKELFKVSIEGYRRFYDGVEYFILINSNGDFIENAFYFLNKELKEASLKQRERCFIALKLLYSYNELFYINNLDEINKQEINRIVAFLKGGVRENEDIRFEGITLRTNQTINHYLGVYRKYYKFLGIQSSIFNEYENVEIMKRKSGICGEIKNSKKIKFSISRKMYERDEVPPYISFDEYKQIIQYVREKYSLRDELIIKLMYEYGLRIGEVLGLTLEDIINSKISKSGVHEIEIRNRFSDRPWQHCKGCMTIYSRNCYQEEEYFKKGYRNAGYQVIKVTDETMDLFEAYINEYFTNPFISEKLKSNLHNKNIADKVKELDKENLNFYLIVSKNYTPLTCNSWNRILKKIFEELRIPFDIEIKKEGLNHKFRHGFAMFKVLIEGYDELKLQRALRHSNPNSCRMYFKPTEEDYKKFQLLKDRLIEVGGINFNECKN